MPAFRKWFCRVTGFARGPHDWQTELAAIQICRDRLIRIPTGFGKSEGILGAWLYYAVDHQRNDWPRRLVWCLPMRVLVEQTADRARAMIARWAECAGCDDPPNVHILMGGEGPEGWYLEPEKPAVLIGTQDMLLSRALNRGYASPRARWPMEFALLNQDCLWVMDEVQLMEVGLATSAQLQVFREQDRSKQLRPCYTWWMSATLQPEWLRSVDTADAHKQWIQNIYAIVPEDRTGELWTVTKSVVTDAINARDEKAFAERILQEHRELPESEYGRITLVVCNTVERACATYRALAKLRPAAELELVHSRFRPAERTAWSERFLNRSACVHGADRIIVATQVVEAGVDISAGCLITELAPWPSLVQRFGRCARYGGTGKILVVDRGQDDKSAAPYESDSLAGAWDAVQRIPGAGLAALEAFEESLSSAERARLYPYEPPHLLMRDEFEELFDTTPDLTGADLDISRFIRSGDERDLHVFWTEVPKDAAPPSTRQPHRDELCAVPFLKARDWLCGPETTSSKKPTLRDNMRAWVWDWIDGRWVTARRDLLLPGRIVCVGAACGGYSARLGFAPESREPVSVVGPAVHDSAADRIIEADNQQDGEPLSVSQWKTIAWHASEVAHEVDRLAAALELPGEEARILSLAARWHDVGKSHPAFQGKIRDAADAPRPARHDLAKGPESAWLKPPGRYVFPDDSEARPAFRHELASVLALFSVLRLYRPDHPALLGPWREVFETLGQSFPSPTAANPTAEIRAVLDCTGDEFDLLVYLVASHHGKVRVALHAAPADQDYRVADGDLRSLPIRGVRNGDRLPPVALRPEAPPVPELELTLEPAKLGLSFDTGASWRERVQKLIQQYGPTALGYLEAILRTADIRASQLPTKDPTLAQEAVV